MEPSELNNQGDACIREIYEETGIREEQIRDLKLKYTLLRRWNDEVVINYIYLGRSTTRDVIECEEGSLRWVNKESVLTHLYLDAISIT